MRSFKYKLQIYYYNMPDAANQFKNVLHYFGKLYVMKYF